MVVLVVVVVVVVCGCCCCNTIICTQYDNDVRCSVRQIESVKYESVQTADVVNSENVEAGRSHEELLERHLSLSVVLQRTGHDRQKMISQTSAMTIDQPVFQSLMSR